MYDGMVQIEEKYFSSIKPINDYLNLFDKNDCIFKKDPNLESEDLFLNYDMPINTQHQVNTKSFQKIINFLNLIGERKIEIYYGLILDKDLNDFLMDLYDKKELYYFIKAAMFLNIEIAFKLASKVYSDIFSVKIDEKIKNNLQQSNDEFIKGFLNF